ncbi:MAG: hypothetical protein M1837_007135 [Sclerophora amabilis]|nr:MAG: hypothetical protein M1837_007135 [Sclerophora amabilis]
MFNMMKIIGRELQDVTQAFSFDRTSTQTLDLCMAPGGFTSITLEEKPTGVVDAFSLPDADEGFRVLVGHGKKDPRVQVHRTDVTMWPGELGVQTVPGGHLEPSDFHFGWPFPRQLYDLVICDGQTLRKQPARKEEVDRGVGKDDVNVAERQEVESDRWDRGTLLVLLHRCHKWRIFRLLKAFDSFSDTQLFKPTVFHREKSSFYLIAKNVQPDHEEAIRALRGFRDKWFAATFGFERDATAKDEWLSADEIQSLLLEFGPKFKELARPVWATQAEALRNAKWMPPRDDSK